jgi:two-component system response regulator VicR
MLQVSNETSLALESGIRRRLQSNVAAPSNALGTTSAPGAVALSRHRILVAEDDLSLSRVLRDALTLENFLVECVSDGDRVIEKVEQFAPDLIVLDVMLPHRDGLELCGILRQSGRTPVVMLSARSQKADKLRGLGAGADDYVTKPFDLEEFLARVRAVLRRTRAAVRTLVLGEVVINFLTRRAVCGSRPINLSNREFAMIHYLAEREGRTVSRHELLTQLWCYPEIPITRSVDHAIARLRKKIEVDPQHPRFVHTMHGDGYCLTTFP